jgi:hypothetical protein
MHQVNLFLDMIQLEDVTASGIFSSLLQYLPHFEMTEDNLGACNDAAGMPGNHSGVKKLVKERFSSVAVCHCLNHRS